MWKKLDTPVPIDPSQVVIGLYVWLDLTWDEHPFFSSRFLVKTQKDVNILHSLDIAGKLYYHPQQSTAEPGAVVAKASVVAPQNQMPEVEADPEVAAKEAHARELRALEKEKK